MPRSVLAQALFLAAVSAERLEDFVQVESASIGPIDGQNLDPRIIKVPTEGIR